MAFFQAKNSKELQHVQIEPTVHRAAYDAGMTLPSYINRMYAADCNMERGTPWQQICASEGLAIPGANDFGIRAATMNDVLEGRAMAASPSNNSQTGQPFGSAARTLYPVAILDIVEQVLARDRNTDQVVFDDFVGRTISIVGDNFIQPVVKYNGTGGPEKARAQRVAEFAEPGNILQISTAEVSRSIPAFTIGIEYSDKAQRALSIDVIAETIARYVEVERESRVYNYLSTLFLGDNDLVTGAIPTVTSVSLDAASTGGVLTHKAWVKFLARNRKYRQITHVAMDIDTYLKVEGRTGRPGTNNYDPTLVRIDPQARPINMTNIGFGNDVKYWIVDSAAEGGPIPAGEIWAVDAPKAATKIKSVTAEYQASEAFALRRSTAMRWDYGEAVYRTLGDSELRAFDRLEITA